MKQHWDIDWAARFIAPFEGFVATPYYDSGGILTQGYGHTGSGIGGTWTQAHALTVLALDLHTAAAAVRRHVTRKLTARQRIAWISFTFNVGEGGLEESTALKRFNAGDTKGAAEALLWWAKDARGNTLAGLSRRRKAEAYLLLHKTSRALLARRKGRPTPKAHAHPGRR